MEPLRLHTGSRGGRRHSLQARTCAGVGLPQGACCCRHPTAGLSACSLSLTICLALSHCNTNPRTQTHTGGGVPHLRSRQDAATHDPRPSLLAPCPHPSQVSCIGLSQYRCMYADRKARGSHGVVRLNIDRDWHTHPRMDRCGMSHAWRQIDTLMRSYVPGFPSKLVENSLWTTCYGMSQM